MSQTKIFRNNQQNINKKQQQQLLTQTLKRFFHADPHKDHSHHHHHQHSKQSNSNQKENTREYIKADNEDIYTAKVEKLFQLENGYFLVYYHRQKFYTMFLLYLRYLIPFAFCVYLIKKNPFYKSYPVVLPITIVALIIIFIKGVVFSRRTNVMIHQILIDPTGTELTFVYKNKFFRQLRNDQVEKTVQIQHLFNPPQDNEYKSISLNHSLFPEQYPFDFETIYKQGYFWTKYYVSQRNFFTIPKRPIYVNYEILCNAFGNRILDFSQVQIYKLRTTQMKRKELEHFLYQQNEYTEVKFKKRFDEAKRLEELEEEIRVKKIKKQQSERLIKESQEKTFAKLKQAQKEQASIKKQKQGDQIPSSPSPQQSLSNDGNKQTLPLQQNLKGESSSHSRHLHNNKPAQSHS